MSYQSQPVKPNEVMKWVAVAAAVICVLLALSVGGCAGLKAFGRAQKRADANNNVALTNIQIRNQSQYARVIAAHDALYDVIKHHGLPDEATQLEVVEVG